MKTLIKRITGREILNAKGNPTVEVEVETTTGEISVASVPSGTSTGSYEAFVLNDGGSRYEGKGTRSAASHVSKEIHEALIGKSIDDLARLDRIMIELDGTENKSRLGANAILPVSVAIAKVRALSQRKPLYRSLVEKDTYRVPNVIATMIAGGAFSTSGLEFEDYLYIFDGFDKFEYQMEAIVAVRKQLEKRLKAKYGDVLEDGGALAPPLHSSSEAFEFMLSAAKDCGIEGHITLGLDVAASELFDGSCQLYRVNGGLSREDLCDYYCKLAKDYPLTYLEDGFGEDDIIGFDLLMKRLPNIQIVGDDLFTSNLSRMQKYHRSANGLLLKINQIGTVSEALDAAKFSEEKGIDVTVSLRSGETTDDFIADLSVAVSSRQIKLGSPVRAERNVKYNRLLRIASELEE